MTVKATQKFIRISPRKLRLVADAVRGRELLEINEVLSILNKRGAKVINETIRQAVANAVNNLGFSEQQLSLKSVMVNEGPVYKRFKAGSRGRAKPILKRSSHVLVELAVAQVEAKAEAPKAIATPAEVKTEAVEAPVEKKAVAKKPAAKKAPTKKAAPKKAAKKDSQDK